MIQNFNVQGGPDFGRQNLPKLRAKLQSDGLDGFLIPHEDEFNNEYLPECNERLMWATGFTGSAGAAIVMTETAAVFVDGRYTLQVSAQVDSELYEYKRLEANGVASWLSQKSQKGQRIGFDPRLHSLASLNRLRNAAEKAGATLIAVDQNPIDQVWEDRPQPPRTPIDIQPLELAGQSHADKRKQIGQILASKGAQAAIITAPASIAWLLNIRGHDVMCTPLVLSTAIIHSDGQTQLYVHADKLSDDVRDHLGSEVSLYDEEMLQDGITALKDQTVWIDPTQSSAFICEALSFAGAQLYKAMDPVSLPKAKKNTAEIAGSQAAHIRDGAALTNFLHWLATDAQSGDYDEIDAASKLESFRAEDNRLIDLSFESISGAGPNGAIVHYRVSTETNIKLKRGSLFLIDSGGQYKDGTTDVTRTIAIGDPTAQMRKHFTLVLKGHIALSAIRFPVGTTGSALDALARMSLWQHGLDYDHGTGHGVGAYLGVHEGPQRISKSHAPIALEPGMIVSNEPGFYKTGAYGIRIENLQFVHEPSQIEGGERPMLGFETLTFAPIDRRLIEAELLNFDEKKWLNAYHQEVFEKISPRVNATVKAWLKEACAAL